MYIQNIVYKNTLVFIIVLLLLMLLLVLFCCFCFVFYLILFILDKFSGGPKLYAGWVSNFSFSTQIT